jgi:hypothetical protein
MVVDQSARSERDPEPHISPERRWWRSRKAQILAAVAFVAALIAVLANLTTIVNFFSSDRNSAPHTGQRVVADGADPSGCRDDARRAHEQPVMTPDGLQEIGKLQLMHSLNCNGMWGRLELTGDQPADGWDVTIAIVRASDSREDRYHARLKTTAFFTGFLQDKGSCFTVKPPSEHPRESLALRRPVLAEYGLL